ncbi:MAG: non-hydrolyzing UDP-N-acetylglucosamine 2-epimerase [Acidobacteriota bacterium]
MNPILLVAGARPNFMKIAPVLRALAARGLPRALVHTGQHYDTSLSQVFFDELGIPAPDVHLDVGSGTHGAQTARVLEAFERHLLEAVPRPRGVVVVGDVNSTMAATLAAVKLGIPVAHVEAGLRSFDRGMPEEVNRLVTDAIADLLLCSEPSGVENLAREGVAKEKVHLVGNVMIDTLARELEGARRVDQARALGLQPGELALVTLHRPSNVDGRERLEALLGFLERVAARLPVVFPAHPRTRARLEAFGLSARAEAIRGLHLCAPLPYRANLSLMASARVVITDSGGIQEETSFLGIPCLTLRPSTERPVTVTLGTNTIVGEDLGKAEALVDDILAGRYKSGAPIPKWDGHAAERVVDVLARAWG